MNAPNPGAKLQFEREAEYYSAVAGNAGSFLTRCNRVVADLVAGHARGRRALDVGCGAGTLSAMLAREGFEVFGCDIAENMVGEAVAHLSPMVADAPCRFRVSDQGTIPFAGLEFDAVTAIGVLPYVQDRGVFIDDMAQLLAADGVMVVSNVNRFSLYVAWGAARQLLSRRHHGRQGSLRRLVSTGLLTGGYVDSRTATNIASAAALDGVMTDRGFSLIAAADMFCLGNIDRYARRTALARMMARRFGWQHIGVYRRGGLA
jgi:SAM-dependent methyltransferase